jgi:hypothetical protein
MAALCIAITGCSARHSQPSGFVRLYSPAGEPLNGGALGEPSCADALSAWFEHVDRDGDGTIDRDEFLADGRRQFAAMDLDKDGIITPAELAQYRAAYEPGAAPAPGPAVAADASSDRKPRRGRRQGGGGNGGGGNDRPDPVMAADVHFHHQVSLPDFMDHLSRQFLALDIGQRGRLAKSDVLRLCHQP